MPAKHLLIAPLIVTLLSACAAVKPPASTIDAADAPQIDSGPAQKTFLDVATGISETDQLNAKPSRTQIPQYETAQADVTETKNSDNELSETDLPQADLVSRLPKTIESFELEGAQAFSTSGDGVNVRYANERKKRRADVFIYPVADNNLELQHDALVMGSTQATMRAIAQAVQQGIYKNLNVIDAATKANGIRTVARVQATYLRDNLASYSLVYQTEHDGIMMKIRMTMPDNEPNRTSREWDRFAEEVVSSVRERLDEKNAADPSINISAGVKSL